MSDEPKYLAWTACITAGVVGLATLGYFLGPVKQPEKQPAQGGRPPAAGGGPGGPGGPGGAGLSQEDLFRMLLQQQLQQQQQQQQPPAQPQIQGPTPSQQAQLFQQQLQRQQMQQLMQQKQQPKAVTSPTSAGSSASSLASSPKPTTKEEKLQEFIMSFRRNITTRAFDEAERVLEQMGKELGRGDEWILTCYEGVRIYLGMQQWQRCIDLSKRFLEHLLASPLKLETSEQIFHILYSLQKAGAKVENMREGINESNLFLERLADLIDSTTDNEEAQEASIELYLHCANILILQKYRQLALWTDLHKVASKVQEKIIPLKPALLDKIVESQASALHQEGKTLEAVSRIRTFYNVMKNLEDESKHAVIPWCLGRMAKFHFYLDQYQESLELLKELSAYHTEQKSQMAAQDLLDLASVYAELGDEENTLSTLDLIKPLAGTHICTRSKFLITTDFTLTDRYEINVKVCRSPPARKEGDEDDDEDNYVRKIDNFFLEVTFENPDKSGEPFVIEQPIDHYDIDLKSPKFVATPEKAWHLIKMVLYKDGSKEEIIGKHYQLIYPGASY